MTEGKESTPARLKANLLSAHYPPNQAALAVRVYRGAYVLPKSVFGKVHAALPSRLSSRRIIATSMRVSLVCTRRS